jgi:hypothetical protein
VERSTKIKTLQFAIFALLALFAAMAIALPIGLSASID